MSSTERGDLLEVIKARYGSLEAPNYSFVEQVVQEHPYTKLVKALSRVAEIEETTDVNDDVSFRYVLRHGGRSWGLNLSMVGPYGSLLRLTAAGEVVTDQAAQEDERQIVRLVKEAGVSLLSREALETRIPFRRVGEETDDATIYQALISDEPLPPWERTV